jgi:hypothetical protein
MAQFSLILIGQQGLGHFFGYRPLIPIGWRTSVWGVGRPELLLPHLHQGLLLRHTYNIIRNKYAYTVPYSITRVVVLLVIG